MDLELIVSIIGGFLVILFSLAGAFKLIRTKEQVVSGGGAWAANFTPSNIKIIGAVECALTTGLVFGLFNSDFALIGFGSAVGMLIIILAATIVHIKRKEIGFVVLTIVVATILGFFIYLYSLNIILETLFCF